MLSVNQRFFVYLMFDCFPGVTTLWLYFPSPVAGFGLLVFEVS